ncbi:MAG: hypothetical protein JWM31_1106, partial [Solirubrobacterales bacterium]|nr:hypothetical protein [Solirubrobacterales bacterium]
RVAAVLAAALLGAAVLSAALLQGGRLILVTLVVGVGLLALALDAADGRAAAALPEAVMWGTAGMLFARSFAQPTVAVGVALLVAGLSLGGLAGDASAITARASAGDPLTLELAAFGGGQALALPALVAVALGAIGTWLAPLGLRIGWTTMLVLEALALTAALRIDPVAPVLGVFLVANADRLVAGVRAEG